jgi:hypothetical protein
MSAWLDGASVLTQDLDTLEETRWFSDADAAHCKACPIPSRDTPEAGFIACPPQPHALHSKPELAGGLPEPETSYLQAEVDLQHGLTMRFRIEL